MTVGRQVGLDTFQTASPQSDKFSSCPASLAVPLPHMTADKESSATTIQIRSKSSSLKDRRHLQLQLNCVGSQSSLTDKLPQTFTSEYELGKSLGAGTVASVRMAKRRDGREVAVKIVLQQDEELRQVTQNEYDLWATLRHTSIVRVDELHTGPYCLMMCMELCHASLQSYVLQNGVFSELSAVQLFQQLLCGVHYLHLKRIVHRDLKPANLLLQHAHERNVAGLQLKITDFNSAKQIGSGPGASLMLSERGTHFFSAPELRFGRVWNERVDIWASGICFYFMLRGRSPFNILDQGHSNLLRAGRLPDVTWGNISDLARNAAQQCLIVEMRDRPTAMELVLHPLFYQDRVCHASQLPALDDVCDGPCTSMQEIHADIVMHLRSCGILHVCANFASCHGRRPLRPVKELSAVHKVHDFDRPSGNDHDHDLDKAGTEDIVDAGDPERHRHSPTIEGVLWNATRHRSSTSWKELRNHSDSLQRLAQMKYERTFAEQHAPPACEQEPVMQLGFPGGTPLEEGCVSSACSWPTAIGVLGSDDDVMQPRSRRKKTPKDAKRWFSTHGATNTVSVLPEGPGVLQVHFE